MADADRPVRRRRLAIAGAAIAALALPGTGAGPLPSATMSAGAADCVPFVRFERVLHRKKVKRHGKVRVKKWFTIEHRTTCEARPAEESTAGTTPRRLKVNADEFSYLLSRPNVGAGNVTIELDNVGEDPHNLNLQLGGSGPVYSFPDVDPGTRLTRSFPLTAGSWRMWCSLLDHDAQGMNATLVVDP
jgi:hypothetical protein